MRFGCNGPVQDKIALQAWALGVKSNSISIILVWCVHVRGMLLRHVDHVMSICCYVCINIGEMAKLLPPLGDNCAQVGISAEAIVFGCELPLLPCSLITKAIVHELSTFWSKCDYSWDNFYEWLRRICEIEVPQTLPCVKADLSRLSKKRAELSRNKHHQQIADLFKEPFFPPEISIEAIGAWK